MEMKITTDFVNANEQVAKTSKLLVRAVNCPPGVIV